jgi:hypothetical protein
MFSTASRHHGELSHGPRFRRLLFDRLPEHRQPRNCPVRMSRKFSGRIPRATISSTSIIDSPAPVVTSPTSPSGSSST